MSSLRAIAKAAQQLIDLVTGVFGILPIIHGGTEADNEDDALKNLIGGATPVTLLGADLSLIQMALFDQDNNQGGKASLDAYFGAIMLSFGLSNYQLTYFFNGALFGISPSGVAGLPLASNGAGVPASFKKINHTATTGFSLFKYSMCGAL